MFFGIYILILFIIILLLLFWDGLDWLQPKPIKMAINGGFWSEKERTTLIGMRERVCHNPIFYPFILIIINIFFLKNDNKK